MGGCQVFPTTQMLKKHLLMPCDGLPRERVLPDQYRSACSSAGETHSSGAGVLARGVRCCCSGTVCSQVRVGMVLFWHMSACSSKGGCCSSRLALSLSLKPSRQRFIRATAKPSRPSVPQPRWCNSPVASRLRPLSQATLQLQMAPQPSSVASASVAQTIGRSSPPAALRWGPHPLPSSVASSL